MPTVPEYAKSGTANYGLALALWTAWTQPTYPRLDDVPEFCVNVLGFDEADTDKFMRKLLFSASGSVPSANQYGLAHCKFKVQGGRVIPVSFDVYGFRPTPYTVIRDAAAVLRGLEPGQSVDVYDDETSAGYAPWSRATNLAIGATTVGAGGRRVHRYTRTTVVSPEWWVPRNVRRASGVVTFPSTAARVMAS